MPAWIWYKKSDSIIRAIYFISYNMKLIHFVDSIFAMKSEILIAIPCKFWSFFLFRLKNYFRISNFNIYHDEKRPFFSITINFRMNSIQYEPKRIAQRAIYGSIDSKPAHWMHNYEKNDFRHTRTQYQSMHVWSNKSHCIFIENKKRRARLWAKKKRRINKWKKIVHCVIYQSIRALHLISHTSICFNACFLSIQETHKIKRIASIHR